MQRKWILAGIVAVIALGALIAAPKFLPKDAVVLDQDVPAGTDTSSDVVVHGSASWRDGDPGHRASGTIDIVTVDGTPFLRLSDFTLTSGPDVYLYLTAKADATSRQDVEGDGVRIPVVTHEDKDSRLNERGTFFVATSLSLDELLSYSGAAAWCDDFNVLFANAAFS
jgi:hypothetical protein